MENDRHIASTKNKTKSIWQIVNKESGNNVQREMGWKESNLQCIAEMFNFCFTEIIGKMIKQNNNINLGCQAPQVMNSCNETLCLSSNRK
jgi:hypothetical protein